MEITTDAIYKIALEIDAAKKKIKKGELVQFDDGVSLIRVQTDFGSPVHIFIDQVKIGETSFESLSKKSAFNTLIYLIRGLITAATKQSPIPYLNKEKRFLITGSVVQYDN